MAIDFFQNELHKVQDRFNQTFGRMVVCNINTRQRVMLAIISLGLLERKIMETHKRSDIQRFIRTRNVLNKFFDQFKEVENVERTDKRENGDNSRAVRNRAYTFAG